MDGEWPLYFCTRLPIPMLAVGGKFLSECADLATFGSLVAVALLMLRNSVTEVTKTQLKVFASIIGGCGVLHFLKFWHRDESLSAISLASGTLSAVLLIFAIAIAFRWLLRNTASAGELQQSLLLVKEELVRERDLLKTLVDNIPDSIYFKDLESRFIRCNQKTADVFMLPEPEHANGKSDHDFFPQHEADEYRADERRIIETGEPLINKEEYEQWGDGEYHWVLSTKMPLRDADQNIIGTFGLSRDITEQKLVEKQLKEKVQELEQLHSQYVREQELFRSLIENIPDAVFFKDHECRFIRVNPAMAADAGFTHPEDMNGLTDAEVWGNELANEAYADELRIMKTGEPIIGKEEEVERKSDGRKRWVLATKMPLRDFDGKIVGTFGLARDITSLKVAQMQLTESKERFELAVRGTNDGLWDWCVENDDVWYAARFRELIGCSNEVEFPNILSSFTDRLHPDDRERVIDSLHNHLQTRAPHDEEYRLKTQFAGYRWFRGRGQATWDASGKPTQMAGSIQDIHDRRLTQESLASTKLKLQQALIGGNVGMWDWNIETNELEVSPELMKQIGGDMKKPWTSFNDWEQAVHPDDLPLAQQKVWDYMEGRSNDYKVTFRLKMANGGFRWILSRGMLFRTDSGQPGRFIGVHVDITELRETQLALAESEARFRGIFNQTFQFIGLMSPDGTLVDANQAALKGAGIAPADVLGKKFWDTIWWTHSPEQQERLREAVRKAASGTFDRFEATHPAPDGSTIYVDFSLKPVMNDAGEVLYLIPEGRDVSELKRYEENLKQRTKALEQSNLELEQFAYIASHDLQEPLRTVVGFCQLLELEQKDALNETGRKYLEIVVDGGRRMQRLINDLLEYSRVARKGTAFKVQNLRIAIDEARNLLHSAIEEAHATFDIGDLPDVNVDMGQMVRVFQNLIGNAVKYRRDQAPHVRIWAERAGTNWNIFVGDNGIGIAQEFAEQVFIIFKRLHTREEYPGTGIGLAICRRIIERHGGLIQLIYNDPAPDDPAGNNPAGNDSAAGNTPTSGSLFQITLPVFATDD